MREDPKKEQTVSVMYNIFRRDRHMYQKYHRNFQRHMRELLNLRQIMLCGFQKMELEGSNFDLSERVCYETGRILFVYLLHPK